MATPTLKYRIPDAQRASFSEVGYTGLNQQSGTLREEFLPELRGKAGIKIYKEMRDNDPIVGAILFAVSMLIRQASWSVKPADESSGAEDAAEFVESCREDMSSTWGDVMSEILTMLPFGWSFLEEVYKKRNGPQRDPTQSSKYTDGRIGWRKLALRSQDSLDKWVFDEHGGTQALVQSTATGQTATIPIGKGLLFRTEANKNNPEGRSVLRNAYRPWYFKKRIEEIEGIGIERDLAGLPVLQPPEGLDLWNPSDALAATYRSEAERVVRSIRRDEQEGVLLPFGWELTLLTTGGRRNFDTTEIVNRYNTTIAMSVMADFIVLGNQNKYGSFALSSSKTAMFGLAIGGWMSGIASVFNRYALPRLMLLNGMNVELTPTLEPGDIDIPDLDALGTYIQRLAQAGFKIFPNEELEEHLLSVAALPTEGAELGREQEIAPANTLNSDQRGPGTSGGAGDKAPTERKQTRSVVEDD